ncbi:hypothetical protein BRADI_1g63110v3 [Brachypodium distachyon]|uniref:Bowman-Birk serine protease inhibitors family domain-containing protein n=1 Tax=Brachypodium distachyon TaxID=15368 RepID=I1H5Q5_BRADI|nr:hypothetical protein BRADI_1g63110v3 [Brachypodium distachyon]
MAKRASAATATVWLLAVAMLICSAYTAAGAGTCFCDCMKNQCMTLGTDPNKFDCAAACTEGCQQVGEQGQPKKGDFCGF